MKYCRLFHEQHEINHKPIDTSIIISIIIFASRDGLHIQELILASCVLLVTSLVLFSLSRQVGLVQTTFKKKTLSFEYP